jgi:hypothetical protein
MQIQFFIEQQTKKVESSCSYAQSQIRNATTMQQVKQYSDISIPSEIKFLKNSIHGYRSLRVMAEKRMEDILDEQLITLSNAKTKIEAQEILANFKFNDWKFLRGDYSNLYRKGDVLSSEIIYKKFSKQI